MGRPIKDNADYFTHDADMRDDPKIKALRRKFKIGGYGVWCMLLESITDSDNFRLKLDLDIIAGDFDVEPEFLQQVIQYCVQLDLLQCSEGCKLVWSKTLDNRFITLLSKRKRKRAELWTPETPQKEVMDVHNTQSRVEKSKVKESYYPNAQKAFEDISNNYLETEPQRNILTNRGWKSADKKDTDALLYHFLDSQVKFETQDIRDVRSHFRRWLNKVPIEELQTLSKKIHERFQAKVS